MKLDAVPTFSHFAPSNGRSTEREEAVAPWQYRGPARSFIQLCRAFALVHQRYVEQKYMEEHVSGMRYSLFNLLPQTTTFTFEQGHNVLGTISVVIDSPAKLPGSKEFDDEFEKLRAEKRVVAEATMFACRDDISNRMEVSMQLMALAFHWCIEVGVDDLCLVVNPKHVEFYARTLGFERLGVEKPMRHVEGNAGILLRCNVADVVNGIGRITRHGQRLLEASRMKGPLSFHRFQILEVEAAVLLNFCPEIYVGGDPEQAALVQQYFPLACADVESSYGFVPDFSNL